MITVRVYDDQKLIALQVLNTEDLEGCDFSKKFRSKSSGDNYGKTNRLCQTQEYGKALQGKSDCTFEQFG